ncbi:MAG: hypothetical protein ACOVNY_07315 [Chitinophagaceae bacterium]
MLQLLNKLITHFNTKPKNLFLFDAVGALLSTSSILIVHMFFAAYLGISKTTLLYLAVAIAPLFLYSTICYLFITSITKMHVYIIGIANLMYCIVTALLVLFFLQTINIIGIAYFLVEIMIIFLVVYIEFRTAFSMA